MITAKPDIQKWASFVAKHPQGNIFQSPEMFALYKSIGCYQPGVLALQDDKQVKGVLLYNIMHEPGKKQFFSYRSVIMGGPLVDNENDLEVLLNAYNNIKTKAIYTQVRNLASTNQRIFNASGFQYNDHLDVCIDLTQSKEQLIEGMHKKRYSNIKRARKKDLVIRIGDIDPQEMIGLIAKTYKRINMPCPPADLFLNVRRYLNEQVVLAAAYHNNTMVACRMYVVFNGIMYDWFAGSDLQYSHLHPNDLLPWECMLWGKDNNMRVYDFGGAGQPQKPYGVRDYKTRFGGELVNNGRYQAVHKPLLYTIGKLGIRFFKLLS